MCWFWLRSWTSNWVSSRLTSLSFIEFFWLDWRLETPLNFFFFLPFLFITKMLNFSFSILNVFVHSVDEFLFLRSSHLFTKLSSFSLNFHRFKFLLKLYNFLLFKNLLISLLFKLFVPFNKRFNLLWSNFTWPRCFGKSNVILLNFLWSFCVQSISRFFLLWSWSWSLNRSFSFDLIKIFQHKFFSFSSSQILFHSFLKWLAWFSFWNFDAFSQHRRFFICSKTFLCVNRMIFFVKSEILLSICRFGHFVSWLTDIRSTFWSCVRFINRCFSWSLESLSQLFLVFWSHFNLLLSVVVIVLQLWEFLFNELINFLNVMNFASFWTLLLSKGLTSCHNVRIGRR